MDAKRPTVADVARRAGTSTAVVSYVLNDGPRQVSDVLRARVSQAMAELNYRPDRRAQALRKQRRWRQIGLLVPDLTMPLFGEFVGTIERAARARDHLTIVANTGYDPVREAEFVSAFVEAGIDGLIVVGASNATETAAMCAQARIPVVWMHNVRGDVDAPIVGVDHVQAGEIATRHLVEMHGCRNIAFVGGFTEADVNHGDRETVEQRYRGAIAVDETEIMHIHTDLTADGAYDATRQFLDTCTAPPAGIIVGTYGQTSATTRAVVDHGLRIPEDVKIVAFDGSQAKYGQFDMTSAQQPVESITQHALERLLTAKAVSPETTGAHSAPWEPFLHVGNTCGC
ncbi:LacI family DNA-binding transcriptional regulator [Rhodococcus sp. NPDC056516]|uniref:LacI family DNA-binding transcriptional regulator n=1 Tax=Rhodococcus sp. NPDC056516 TaxID=3345847 RepID=UPI00366F509B